ncbi:DUF1877 family protein [Neolewinella lacunae]|uniref:DUF1877 family protein n=1 Tax=Neolewinella lacunae TaxID=1517758 RepID=A0A923PM36_9BACT|nr:DUF1877 family protein [Neolewinella lacunae]MBC6994940.1 DUF1877 family protein [Neolewinella lacunae]MDN3636116.1 DUF1877 family protein [Neolewinella lacunae]
MGLDLSMTAVPIEMKNIFSKVIEKRESEYPSIIFSLPRAFKTDFCDFGHPDWIEFKKDAQMLLEYYPNKQFDNKYYFDSNRTYDALDYLISKKINDYNYTFFGDGIEFKESLGVQGRTLKYWDIKILRRKSKLVEKIESGDLMKHYDFEKMEKLGVYKISQINCHKENVEEVFINLKSFLSEAIQLNGYVLIIKD